jgi:hypothetical protein
MSNYYTYNSNNYHTNPHKIRVSTMTVGELKAANASILDGYFTWRYIKKATADNVREMLVNERPDIYRW